MLVYAQKFCLSKPVFKIKGKFCGLLLKHWYLSDQQGPKSSKSLTKYLNVHQTQNDLAEQWTSEFCTCLYRVQLQSS